MLHVGRMFMLWCSDINSLLNIVFSFMAVAASLFSALRSWLSFVLPHTRLDLFEHPTGPAHSVVWNWDPLSRNFYLYSTEVILIWLSMSFRWTVWRPIPQYAFSKFVWEHLCFWDRSKLSIFVIYDVHITIYRLIDFKVHAIGMHISCNNVHRVHWRLFF